jgi:hypothetical protein
MVFSLTDLSYGEITLYVFVLGVSLSGVIGFTLVYLLLSSLLRTCAFYRLFYKNIKGSDFKKKATVNFYKRLLLLLWEFFDLMVCSVSGTIVIFLVTKALVENSDFSYGVVTVIIVGATGIAPFYLTQFGSKVKHLFDRSIEIGDVLEIRFLEKKKKLTVVDICPGYYKLYVMNTGEEESDIFVVKENYDNVPKKEVFRLPFSYVNSNILKIVKIE